MSNLSGNANRYIFFSVFFTARAYYPILAILFIDLGLSLDQFVMLNLIWALTIFLFEVPSGALADTIGRRKLLIAASVLMIFEMLCLLFAPREGGAVLLILCVINRICSGLSEACASGADEALAYDSLPTEDRSALWDNLLVQVMRWRSAGFIVAMIIGGLVYDPQIFNIFLPDTIHISVNFAHRIPVILVLIQAVICLFITLRMVEPPLASKNQNLTATITHTLSTARWVLDHKKILVVIIVGVVLDSIVRNFATINSSYYRLIDLPEWTYGFLGAAFGVLGWFIPGMAKYFNIRFSVMNNLLFIAAGTFLGLIALIPMWKIYGVIPAMFLMTMMFFLSFTVSRVLNEEAESSQRATVLSVKGLIFNLGYGVFSFAFSLLLMQFPDQSKIDALQNALIWQLVFFTLVICILLFWARKRLKSV